MPQRNNPNECLLLCKTTLMLEACLKSPRPTQLLISSRQHERLAGKSQQDQQVTLLQTVFADAEIHFGVASFMASPSTC